MATIQLFDCEGVQHWAADGSCAP